MSDTTVPSVDPSINTHIGFETETTVLFIVLALCALFIDIWAHRKDQPIALKTAIAWTLFWICVSLSFAGFLYFHFNGEVASLFLAGYLFEQALSVDNLFVIMAIFAWFKIPEQYTHRVLYWGVLGAIFFRLLFVIIGSTLFALGPYVELVFALMVLGSGVMMLRSKDSGAEENQDYSHHIAFRVVRWFFPVFPRLVGHNFFINHAHANEELKKPENKDLVLKRVGPIFATPLFLCLAVIETSDILFAFDSVPAVIAVSREPLIVYSAMMFAVLGLRSMYFVLDALRQYLVHLEKAVIVLLFFIAFKLAAGALNHLTGFGFDISVYTSLIVIAVILGLGILASFVFPAKDDVKKGQLTVANNDAKQDTAHENDKQAIATKDVTLDTLKTTESKNNLDNEVKDPISQTSDTKNAQIESSTHKQSDLEQPADLNKQDKVATEFVDNNPQAPIMGDAATSIPPNVELAIIEQSKKTADKCDEEDKTALTEPTVADAATTVPPDVLESLGKSDKTKD